MKHLVFTVAAIMFCFSVAQSQLATALYEELGYTIIEEAVTPSGAVYMLIRARLTCGESKEYKTFKSLVDTHRDNVRTTVVYSKPGGGYGALVFHAPYGTSSCRDWVGGIQNLTTTYGTESMELRTSQYALPPPSRPRGAANSCTYVSTRTSTTYTCFNSVGLVTYRNACTMSYRNGVYTSTCRETRW